jgi:glycosyltransferase involved in cell wall biosynthesis
MRQRVGQITSDVRRRPRRSPLKPTVSVVLPVYNGQRFLAEAVDSVLRQTYREFQFVIVDDGSTDRTAEILDGFARSDSRVVVRSHLRNLGVRSALNEACHLASGECLAVMNHDDICQPDRLLKQVEFLIRYPDVGLVGGAVEVIDERGTGRGVRRYPTAPNFIPWAMIFYNCFAHPTVMMRRQALEAVGYYPSGYEGGTDDYALVMRLSRVTRIANLHDVVLRYRVSGENMTSKAWDAQEIGANRVVREAVEQIVHRSVPVELASALRGLSTNHYPDSIGGIRELGDLIQELREAFLKQRRLNDAEARAVNRDAAVRLWLLAGLAARRSPSLGYAFGASAARISPMSALSFVRKASRQMTTRLRRRAHGR